MSSKTESIASTNGRQEALSAVPLNFLLGCSQSALSSFELARLAEVANLRKELHVILDRMIDQMSEAALAAWFRETDREMLKRAIENPDDVMAWAREQIRNEGRSEKELVPRTSLAPGAAHLAAAMRYQERNVAKGLCAICPHPLARGSVRYCETHLTAARARHKPKGAKGEPPGSREWLYEGVFESSHGRQPGSLKALADAREKRTQKKDESRE
jgi:hypothetical protein